MLIMSENYINWVVKGSEQKIRLKEKDVGEVGAVKGENLLYLKSIFV